MLVSSGVKQRRGLVTIPAAMLVAGCSLIAPFVQTAQPASDTVPWVAATVIPEVSPARASLPNNTQPCDVSQLGITVVTGAGGGTVEGRLTLTLPQDDPCTLAGPPRTIGIRLEDGGRDVPVEYATRSRPGPGDKAVHPNPPVLIDLASPAEELFIWSNWCGDPDAKIRFVVQTTSGPGATTGLSNATYGAPRCDQPGLPTRITGYAFRDSSRQPAIDVAVDAPPTAVAGEFLDYTVTLTDTDSIPLAFDPCPEYAEVLLQPSTLKRIQSDGCSIAPTCPRSSGPAKARNWRCGSTFLSTRRWAPTSSAGNLPAGGRRQWSRWSLAELPNSVAHWWMAVDRWWNKPPSEHRLDSPNMWMTGEPGRGVGGRTIRAVYTATTRNARGSTAARQSSTVESTRVRARPRLAETEFSPVSTP